MGFLFSFTAPCPSNPWTCQYFWLFSGCKHGSFPIGISQAWQEKEAKPVAGRKSEPCESAKDWSSSSHVCFNSIAGNRTSWWKSMDIWWGWTWGIIFACRKGELQDDFELRAVSPVQHGIHLIRRSKVLYIYHHCAFLSIQNSAVLSWRCLIGWGTRAFSKRCLVMPVTRDSRGGDVISDWS